MIIVILKSNSDSNDSSNNNDDGKHHINSNNNNHNNSIKINDCNTHKTIMTIVTATTSLVTTTRTITMLKKLRGLLEEPTVAQWRATTWASGAGRQAPTAEPAPTAAGGVDGGEPDLGD